MRGPTTWALHRVDGGSSNKMLGLIYCLSLGGRGNLYNIYVEYLYIYVEYIL